MQKGNGTWQTYGLVSGSAVRSNNIAPKIVRTIKKKKNDRFQCLLRQLYRKSLQRISLTAERFLACSSELRYFGSRIHKNMPNTIVYNGTLLEGLKGQAPERQGGNPGLVPQGSNHICCGDET
jgi:hypothetical protein